MTTKASAPEGAISKGGRISFLAPLPPSELHSNPKTWRIGRDGKRRRLPPHWSEKVKAKQAYSERVYAGYCDNPNVISNLGNPWFPREPWKRARVTYQWRFCGNAPDEQNLGANLKALTDILCCAPNIGLRKNNTTYLGLVEDDKGIEPVYLLVQVPHKTEQGVLVTLEELR